MEKQILTRQELYHLVWSQPILTLSKKYSISDVGLRKTCIRLGIPLPESGHWQKLKFGKKIQRLPLSTNHTGDQEVTLTLRNGYLRQEVGELTPLKLLQKEIENQLTSKLVVPNRLTDPDKLVVAAKSELTNKASRWLHHGLTSCSWQHLDIKVSPDNILRSLRFWDTLIKALRMRGHEVRVGNHTTVVNIQEYDFKILLRERKDKKGGN